MRNSSCCNCCCCNFRYSMTLGLYILQQYRRRVDRKKIMKNIKSNSHNWTDSGKVIESKVTEYLSEHLDLIFNADLFKKVTLEARQIKKMI